jgi:hypothetical protein
MVYVFKTTVKNKTQIKKLKPALDSLPADSKWNFDLEDCDRILRIDSKRNYCNRVITLLQSFGFECTELE